MIVGYIMSNQEFLAVMTILVSGGWLTVILAWQAKCHHREMQDRLDNIESILGEAAKSKGASDETK
jgi:hypothetical protein